MKVIKASGVSERFSPRKVYRGILKAGGSRKLARHTVIILKKSVSDGMQTDQILNIILTHLKEEPDVAARYDLKRAIMSLGPSGFPFETYFAQILKEYGYDVKTSNMVRGKRVVHEVDIIASKKYAYMIECKYHNHVGIYTGLKDSMYTYARFLDIRRKNLDYSWLVTNTHCSRDAINYSRGVGQKITSWEYPKGKSLRELIEKKGLYPITIIKYVSNDVKNKLYDAKIMLAKDLGKYSIAELRRKTGLSEKLLEKIMKELKVICKISDS